MPTSTALALRSYQQEAVDTVFSEAEGGVARQLIVMATGLGKTCTAIETAKQWRDRLDNTLLGGTASGRRILWLTHRDELVQQTIAQLDAWWPELGFTGFGIVKADINELDRDFVIASVQTLAHETRLNRLLESQLAYGKFGLVISDEHHHSVSPTWARTLDALGCGEPDGPLMIGLTATPGRADGVGLRATTDKIVFERDAVWAISQGHLVPPKGMTVDVDLSTVKSSGGDYQAGSLGDVLELQGAHAAIAKLVTEHCSDRKTVIFTPTVHMAELVAEECRIEGHAAEMVQGETPLPERRDIYRRLRSGETKVLVNCMVLTEGFDEPSVDCIIVARPTKSESLFIQMVGRGLRLYPGKDDALVICLAGTERHKLATLATLAGRTFEQAMKARELASQGVFDFALEFDRMIEEEAKRADMKARNVNLLATSVRRRVAWGVIDPESTFAKRLETGDTDDKSAKPVIVIKRQRSRLSDDLWKVVKMNPHVVHKQGREWTEYNAEVILADVDWGTAQAHADNIVRRIVPSSLIDPHAPWRQKPASPKQEELLKKNGVPFIPGNMTSGNASDLLDIVFLRRIADRA